MSDERPMNNEPLQMEIVPAERVRKILERAAEIDSRGIAGINTFELQKIAEEAGISAAAFAQAMREESGAEKQQVVTTTPVVEHPGAKPTLLRRIKNAIPYTLVGGVFGLWGVSGDDEIMVMGVMALVLIAMYRVFAHRKDRDTTGFQVEVLSLFTGLYLSWAFGGAIRDADVATAIPVMGVTTALIGTVLIAVVGRFVRAPDKRDAVPAQP